MFPLISTEGLLSWLSFDLNIIRFIKMICLVFIFLKYYLLCYPRRGISYWLAMTKIQ